MNNFLLFKQNSYFNNILDFYRNKKEKTKIKQKPLIYFFSFSRIKLLSFNKTKKKLLFDCKQHFLCVFVIWLLDG